MNIESVEWHKLGLSPEQMIENWATAEDILAIVNVLMTLESMEGKDISAVVKEINK